MTNLAVWIAAPVLAVAFAHGGDYTTPDGCDPASTKPSACNPADGPVEITEYYEPGQQAAAEARCRDDLERSYPGSTCHTEPAMDFEDMGHRG